MNPQFSAELLKLRTTRSLPVAAAAAAAFAALVPALASADPVRFGVAPLGAGSLVDMMRAPAQVTGGAALLVGILAASSEYTHSTMLTTRLVEPNPGRVLAAKMMAMAAVGALMAVLVEGVAALVGAFGLAANGVGVELVRSGAPGVVATVVLLTSAHAILGAAIGTLLRNTAAAVGVTLIWVLGIENVLPLVTGNPGLGRWLPGNLAQQVLTPQPGGMTATLAAAMLVGYSTVLVAVAGIADWRRDP